MIKHFRPGTADENAIREVRSYVKRLNAHGLSPKGLAVIDVGAHIGAFTDWALGEGAARVAAYEPHPINFKYLRKNCPRAELHNAALVHDDRKETFLTIGPQTNPLTSTERFSTSRNSTKNNKIVTTVKCLPFKEALHGIDAIKFDAEGAEYSLLNAVDLPKRIKWIVGEFEAGKSSLLLPDGTFTKSIRTQDYKHPWELIERIKSQGFEYLGQTNMHLPRIVRQIAILFVRRKR